MRSSGEVGGFATAPCRSGSGVGSAFVRFNCPAEALMRVVFVYLRLRPRMSQSGLFGRSATTWSVGTWVRSKVWCLREKKTRVVSSESLIAGDVMV